MHPTPRTTWWIGGSVANVPGDDVQLDEVAAQLRAVLAALCDPDDDLTAPAATRNRIEGAALTLEALAGDYPAAGADSNAR